MLRGAADLVIQALAACGPIERPDVRVNIRSVRIGGRCCTRQSWIELGFQGHLEVGHEGGEGIAGLGQGCGGKSILRQHPEAEVARGQIGARRGHHARGGELEQRGLWNLKAEVDPESGMHTERREQ